MNLIDLDNEGLGEYKDWFKKYLESLKPAPLSIEAVLDALLTELFAGFDAKAELNPKKVFQSDFDVRAPYFIVEKNLSINFQ